MNSELLMNALSDGIAMKVRGEIDANLETDPQPEEENPSAHPKGS